MIIIINSLKINLLSNAMVTNGYQVNKSLGLFDLNCLHYKPDNFIILFET